MEVLRPSDQSSVGSYCGLTPPNFHFRPTNSISYEGWHLQLNFNTLLRSLKIKFGLRRSPKWPGSWQKKVGSKILKSEIFELHKRYTPQKKAENRFSKLESNIWLFIEKWGKKIFSWFSMIKIKKIFGGITSFYHLQKKIGDAKKNLPHS